MIICTPETIICEPKMIAGVASIIVCGREMVLCSMTMIAGAGRIIVPEAEKTESLTELIAEEMEILVSPSSTIADDMEMIVKETQLIGTTVLSKGKTGGKEAAKQVTDVKPPAWLVWFVVFPRTPSKRACGVPFLTR
jgi:hypothetical protein